VTGGIGAISSGGLFTAGSDTGSGTVIATASGITGSASVSVTDKGVVAGTVSSTTGDAIEGLTVKLTSTVSTSAYSSSTTSGSDGSYTLSEVPIGTYFLQSLGTAQYLASSTTVTVSTGETVSQNIEVTPRLSVSGESILGSPITVAGIVTNNGDTSTTGVTVAYIFYASDGTVAGAGSATLGTIDPLGSKTFSIVPLPSVFSYSYNTRTVVATGF